MRWSASLDPGRTRCGPPQPGFVSATHSPLSRSFSGSPALLANSPTEAAWRLKRRPAAQRRAACASKTARRSLGATSSQVRSVPWNRRLPALGIEVVKGAAHFDVTHDPARVFRVLAAGVSVEVIGTSFTVELYSGGARVAVDCGARQGPLERQESHAIGRRSRRFRSARSRMWTLRSTSFRTMKPRTVALPFPPLLEPRAAGHPANGARWPAMATSPERTKLFAEKVRAPCATMRKSFSCRPTSRASAGIPIKRSRHCADCSRDMRPMPRRRLPRSRWAACSSTSSQRPRERPQAFARSYRLAPNGALSQDALAREVEAWSRAGESALAHERALRYVQTYPQGRKVNAVRHYGGIE